MQTTKTSLQKTVRAHPSYLDRSRRWLIVDATGKTLGRLAVDIAKRLIGKHKPWYCDQRDCGDYVIVTNIDQIKVTGAKVTDKVYYSHTGYKGHLKEANFAHVFKKTPAKVLELAVKGMLPKNKMRKERLKRMKVFVGADHPYAQFAPIDLYDAAASMQPTV